MEAIALEGGFANAPIDAANAFRSIMTVMARPGDILCIEGATPPDPLSVAMGTLLLTLCDPETPLYLGPDYDTPAIRDWITFHTGAPFCEAACAVFAIGCWGNLPLEMFPVGTAQYPDRSTTVLVELDKLEAEGAQLRGPGIETIAQLSLPETNAFQQNAQRFPLGLDFYFTAGPKIAALPRTTQVS